MTTRLGAAAAEYARRGWPVGPLHTPTPGVPGGCSCRNPECHSPGKHPRTPRGHRDFTTDPKQVGEWWARWPDANIGFPPGRAGLLVLDWDDEAGRREAVKLGCYSEPTMIVETARGAHLYFTHPGGTVGNRKLNGVLDVRADAGYVLLPPSIHPTGALYRAHGTLHEIRDLPPAALDALRDAAPTPRPLTPPEPPIDAGTPRRRAYVIAAIESESMELANTREGSRNHRLNKAAFSLARFVATGEADPAKLADLLTIAARHAGLPDHEIQKTIRSAFTAREVAV